MILMGRKGWYEYEAYEEAIEEKRSDRRKLIRGEDEGKDSKKGWKSVL